MSYFDLREIETQDRRELLEFIASQVAYGEMRIATCMYPEMGAWLGEVFRPNGGTGSDPLWAIAHIPESGMLGKFQVWRGDDIDRTEETEIYSAEEFVAELIKQFYVYLRQCPEHRAIVDQIMKQMPEYQEKLRT